MKFLQIIIFIFNISLLNIFAVTSQPKNPYLKEFSENGELLITIPAFSKKNWEKSLITYPIEFTAKNIKESDLILHDTEGKEIPFQISEARKDSNDFLEFGKISFLTDHRNKSIKIFKLITGKTTLEKVNLSKNINDNGIIIDTGNLKILVPKSANKPNPKEPIPSPIIAIENQSGWQPLPALKSEKFKLISLISESENHGPIYITHKIIYNFSGGSKYEITLTCIRDKSHIEINENFKGVDRNFAINSLKPIKEHIKGTRNQDQVSLNEAKDWILSYDGEKRSASEFFLTASIEDESNKILENAYEKSLKNSSEMTEYDCLEIAEAAFIFPNHPLSSEWHDQAERILRQKKSRASFLPIVSSKLSLFLDCVLKLRKEDLTPYKKIKKPIGAQLNGSISLSKSDNEKINLSTDGVIILESTEENQASHSSSILVQNKNYVSENSISSKYMGLGELEMGTLTIYDEKIKKITRTVLNINNQYSAIIDDIRIPKSKVIFSSKTSDPKVFLARSHNQTLKINSDRPREIIVSAEPQDLSGVSIIPKHSNTKVNKVSINSTPTIAVGPLDGVVLIETENGTDRIFSNKNSQKISLTGKEWSIDSALGIIREIGPKKRQLAVLGNDQDTLNKISSEHLTLEIEGRNVGASAEYRIPKESESRNPIIFSSSGSYFAPSGGTLKIGFGNDQKINGETKKKLLAFWKFDEGKGFEITDIKDPDKKAILNGNNDPQWIPGVGFGKGSAIKLQPSEEINTAFEQTIPGSSSVAIWIKTTESGNLIHLSQGEGINVKDHSRTIQVTKSGTLKVSQHGDTNFEIESDSKINDGKWHHIAWVTKEEIDESIIDHSFINHSVFIDSIVEGEKKIKKYFKKKIGKYKIRIGGTLKISSNNQNTSTIPGINGSIDNLRIYNFSLSQKEIHGFTMVGLMRSPIAITSSPKKMLRVGENFEYNLKYTGGGSFVRFTFNNIPKWAKIEGRIIGTPSQKDLGLSKPITIVGMSPWGPGQQSFSLSVLPPLVSRQWKIQANGKQLLTKYTGMGVEAQLPTGAGTWKLTKEKAPMRPPLIMKVENSNSGINFQLRGTPGVTNYLLESSQDEGKTWQTLIKGRGLRHKTNSLKSGNYLLRASSLPAGTSPIISENVFLKISSEPPSQPERPDVFPAKNSVRLKWSHQIGATEYNLFKRKKGEIDWQKIYTGSSLGFVDKNALGSLQKFDIPGYKSGANYKMDKLTIYEYCISSIDKNGESPKSEIRNSDPRNW